MKNHYTSSHFLLLFLVGALLLWSGCDPEEEPTCDDSVPEISFGEYCSPNLLTVRNLGVEEITEVDLPNFCDLDYSRSRTVKVAVPAGGTIYLHQYINFPGIVFTELIGADCEGTFDLLNSCLDRTNALVRSLSVDASNYSTLYIRVIYPGDNTYQAGDRETDNIAFAAFDTAPNDEPFADNDGTPYFVNCGNRTSRIILTPGSGRDPIEAARTLGLPFDVCECSDGELVTVYAPAGVDLNAVRPRIKEKDTEVDTVSTTFDFIVPIPTLTISDEIDPRQRPEVSENECLIFEDPAVGSAPNAGVKVTIVDSGVDVTAPNVGVFLNNADVGGLTTCIPTGILGSDLIYADEIPNDEVGHGTAVASVFLSGYESEVPLTLVNNKFFGPNGGTLFDALCATYAGIKSGSDIINWSWGFESEETPAALITLLDNLLAENIAIVNSAGNDGQVLDMATPYWPAFIGDRYDNLLVVGSYDGGFLGQDPFVKFWSNRGVPQVGVAAFFTANALRLNPGSNPFPIGTSISAPLVTQALAELKGRNPNDDASSLIGRFLKEETLQNASLGGLITDSQYLPITHSSEGDCDAE